MSLTQSDPASNQSTPTVGINPTTSFESALGLSPLFVREIRPMITLLNLADQLQHVSNRILA
jgi:hypothetical protein